VDTLIDVARFMIPGAITTITIALVAFPFALLVAVLTALPRVLKIPAISSVLRVYVDFIRTTPLLAHIFVVFYAFPLFFDIRLDPVTTAVIVLALHHGAYQSEVIRAAYLSVPPQYSEAARVLGMSDRVRITRVVAPLAVRVALPPLANSLLEIFLSTVVLSLVALHDVFFKAQEYFQVYRHGIVEGYVVLVLFFLAVGVPALRLIRRLERRLAFPA
jgi:His/Glu/Gln/Arg/opine family amino acid ABC transporter permease subunit